MQLRTRCISCAKSRKGFSLTEIAIVLMVIGLLISAVWVAAGQEQNASRANQTAQDVMTIAANMRSTFQASSTFTGGGEDLTVPFITAGIFPQDLIMPDGKTTNDAYGQAVAVWEAPIGTNARTFRVSFYGTPPDACLRIASQVANIGTSDGPNALVTACGAGGVVLVPGTPPLSSDIEKACNKNVTGTGCTASTEFDFTIH